MKLNKFIKLTLIGIGAMLLLCACAERVQVTPNVTITQANLLEKCTKDTPLPVANGVTSTGEPNYDGNSVIAALQKWQTIYDLCAGKDDKLVDAIVALQEQKTVKVK